VFGHIEVALATPWSSGTPRLFHRRLFNASYQLASFVFAAGQPILFVVVDQPAFEFFRSEIWMFPAGLMCGMKCNNCYVAFALQHVLEIVELVFREWAGIKECNVACAVSLVRAVSQFAKQRS
jgi:hypothetical protein